MKLDTLLHGAWLKDPYPVLDVGPKGVWDDLMVDCPFVLSRRDGEYLLFYTGHGSKNHEWAIGRACSADLDHWVKDRDNPFLSPGQPGICGKHIDGAVVLFFRKKFFLFFESVDECPISIVHRLADALPYPLRSWGGFCKRKIGRLLGYVPSQAVRHASRRSIGLVMSDDMLHWSAGRANPVFRVSEAGRWDSSGVFSPCILPVDGKFYLFYGGSNGKTIQTGLAESHDLYSWEKNPDPVLSPGVDGSWDESSVIIVSILRLEDAYIAFYEGQDRHNQYAVGLAFSFDGRRWEKYGKNPILTKGSPGAYDERIVNSPHGFQRGNEIFCFYGASNFKMEGRCMRARFSAKSPEKILP
jgi:hypothetical protein